MTWHSYAIILQIVVIKRVTFLQILMTNLICVNRFSATVQINADSSLR